MKPKLSDIKKLVFAIASLLFVQVPSSTFAQYITASGAGDILEFYSPVFLSGGPSVTSDKSPAADILNPAVSAGLERLNLDFSILGLVDLNASSTSFGTAINLGLSIPTNSGVWGFSGHYVGSELSLLDLGPMASLNLSFAKEFFDKTYFGAGIGFHMGADSDSFAWGLGLDLGMLQLLGQVGYLHDVRWGLVFRGIGKGYKSDLASYSSYPAPFTPALGISFFPIITEQLSLKTQIDLWSPSFGDLRLDAGLQFNISDFFVGRIHFPFSLIESISSSSSRVPIAFGVSLQFKTDLPVDTKLLDFSSQDWSRSEVDTHFIFTPVRSSIWGIGAGTNIALGVIDENPPIINLDIDPIVYCSPNFDGIKDDLLVPVTITDERLVMGYRFVITDDQSSVIREIRNKDQRPENQGLEGLVDRLLYTKSGVTIPARLRWDGTDHKGQIVVDGTYNYYVEAWDDNGNLSRSREYIVEIDNEIPSIEATPVSYVFSPNGDGNKDSLVIEQKGSVEDLWEAEILTSRGKQIVKFIWSKEAPPDFIWDGRAANEFLASDGVYSYRITSTDLAGNSINKQINNIIIDTQATPILVSVDKAEISPNADNIQDFVNYTFQVPVNTGIENWQFVIKNTSNFQVRNYSGKSNLPGFIVFDGLADNQETLPEGIYSAHLSIDYQNGNKPRTEAPQINIDITKPFAAIKGNLSVFSPNSDGNKDTVKIFQETSEEVVWNATLQNESGGIELTKTWRGLPDETFVWNGTKADGLLAADGVYSYFLEATDRAGNTGKSNLISVELDNADTPIFITTNATHFSPNADGVVDRISFLPRLNENTGIDRYSVDVIKVGAGNIERRIVRSFRGRGEIPSEIIWDGLEDNGSLAEDGQYFAELRVVYLKGNNPVVRTSSFTVDTIYPTVQLIADYLLFSPDGDSRKDTILVSQVSSNEVLWEGEILNDQKVAVRSFYWKGNLSKFEWDGKDENGNQLPDGLYSYQVAATDLSGNKTSALLQDIKIDSRKPLLFITLDTDGFSPNDDGYRDAQTIGLVSNLNSGIKKWHIDFIHESYGIQRSIVGTGSIPERFPWDGKAGKNSICPDGLYQVEVMIEYQKGDLVREKTTKFRLDTLAPKVNIDLSPKPFSPDNDGVNDELTIGIEVDDISPIAGWTMVIYDPTGSLFTSFKGRGKPGKEIIWNGLSDDGELVQSAYDYTLAFFIQDDLGNQQEIQKIIPVDVLVIRDGNDFKIRISSITFPPNSADLTEVTGEKANQNSRTLVRLGEIFEKYGRYTILIEGHANQMKYLDTIAEQIKEQQNILLPLSEERAEAVKQQLVLLGITNERMSTGGIGALKPIVPFSDQENRWKNRRVEFILKNR